MDWFNDERLNVDTPEELPEDAPGLYDSTWTDDEWRVLLELLIDHGLVSWRDVTTTILGELNPSQVGTQIASAKSSGFKANHATLYPDESFMPHVMQWLYAQDGRCVDCKTRLDLQADHIEGRETFDDPHEADWLSNLCLRCRRHNVAKRKSHKNRAGRTLLPAQQALMWILLQIRPRTKMDFARLCRLYGMTMASVRFDEAWAMAVWLERAGEYDIASPGENYDLILWEDNAVTRRVSSGGPTLAGSSLLASAVPGDSIFCFVSTPPGARQQQYTELPLDVIPFVYRLGARPMTDIAVWPLQHGVTPLAPRGHELHAYTLRTAEEAVVLTFADGQTRELAPVGLGRGYFKGRKLSLSTTDGLTLEAVSRE
ncbi:HNH endonuclease [Geodermatophilus sp. SYSU D00815]